MRIPEKLKNLELKKRPEKVKIEGRILFLFDDPELVRRQIQGEDLWWDMAPLRDNISTDEITPGYICYHYDEKLGNFPYIGFKAGNEYPIKEGDVKKGGFSVSVSGKRRGKGSSREQAPYAEKCAGIQLVVAENIERIYKQNCQNLGILTSTDFSVLEDIRSGKEIPLSKFYEDEDEITSLIVQYGGLFPFNVARIQGKVTIPAIQTQKRPMTLAEKILARHMVRNLQKDEVGVDYVKPGDAGFVRVDYRFSHEYVTPMAAIFFEKLVDDEVNDRDSILFFRDHLTFLEKVMPEERVKRGLLDLAKELARKQAEFAQKQGIRLFGETDSGGSVAICHSMMCEEFALPGQVIVGSDSHTPHSGAVGAFAFGIGTTELFNSWITKDVRIKVPETVFIDIQGPIPAGITAKDVILEILRHPYVKEGQAIGKVIEYGGTGIKDFSIDERATLTNMAAEIGGFTGIVAPDEKTLDFLISQRGMKKEDAEKLIEGLVSDQMAQYAKVIQVDATQLRPMIALPGDPGKGMFIDELEEKIPIDIAYGGSCTGGKAEDMDYYARVLKAALEQGKKVHPKVKFYLQFGSQRVKEYCRKKGYIEIFEKAGV
ncbi:MAG: 3-isopropylmalate dehydratase, partial [Planctomycetota bacterium]